MRSTHKTEGFILRHDYSFMVKEVVQNDYKSYSVCDSANVHIFVHCVAVKFPRSLAWVFSWKQSPLGLFVGDLCHITALSSAPKMEQASAHHLKQEGPWNLTKLAWEWAHWQYTSTQSTLLVWKSSGIIESEWCWNAMTTHQVVAGRIYCWWQPGERERTRLKDKKKIWGAVNSSNPTDSQVKKRNGHRPRWHCNPAGIKLNKGSKGEKQFGKLRFCSPNMLMPAVFVIRRPSPLS